MSANRKTAEGPTKAKFLAVTSAITLLLFILLITFTHALREAGFLNQSRYIVYIACGLVFAQVAFFFKKESTAEVALNTRVAMVKLGGQAAIAAVVVLGNYFLVPREETRTIPQTLVGYVTEGDDLEEEPVKSTKFVIYGGPETFTSDSGEFSIREIKVKGQPMMAGDAVTFNVNGWIIWDPYLGARGRMYLPKPSTEAVRVRVFKRGDRRFLAGNSIEGILGQRTFEFGSPGRNVDPTSQRSPEREWRIFLEARAKEIGFPRRRS